MGDNDEIPTSPSQKKFENVKNLSMFQNLHNLTPPLASEEERGSVTIVNALKGEQHIIKSIMQLKGYMLNPLNGNWEVYRNPVMNELGIGNFIAVTSNIAETIEYSSIHEDDIPKFVIHFFKINYPYFTIYYEEYGLSKSDFNLVSSVLFAFILSAFSKAKGGKFVNVVGRTFSEDVLGKLVSNQNNEKKPSGFMSVLAKLNPMKK